jgi:hypothetical protein
VKQHKALVLHVHTVICLARIDLLFAYLHTMLFDNPGLVLEIDLGQLGRSQLTSAQEHHHRAQHDPRPHGHRKLVFVQRWQEFRQFIRGDGRMVTLVPRLERTAQLGDEVVVSPPGRNGIPKDLPENCAQRRAILGARSPPRFCAGRPASKAP